MSALLMLPAVWARSASPGQEPSSEPAHRPTGQPARIPRRHELAFYRKYTEALLRRYMRMSMELGRTPSLLGQQVFRGRSSSYRIRNFEDAVIFVHDIERCLNRLDASARQLVARIALQEYTQGEAAGLLHMSVRSVVRKYADALDHLTSVFLAHKLLTIPALDRCQEPGDARGAANGCNHAP